MAVIRRWTTRVLAALTIGWAVTLFLTNPSILLGPWQDFALLLGLAFATLVVAAIGLSHPWPHWPEDLSRADSLRAPDGRDGIVEVIRQRRQVGRGQPCVVLIDGVEVGRLRNGVRIQVPVASGPHELSVLTMRFGPDPVPMQVDPHKTTQATVHAPSPLHAMRTKLALPSAPPATARWAVSLSQG